MSFKPQVQTDSSGNWYDNALRFATREEAEANASNLADRWFLVTDYRAVESEDPVNYAWIDGRLVSVETPPSAEQVAIVPNVAAQGGESAISPA